MIDPKATDRRNPKYKPGECKAGGIQAEAIAQARLIARLNEEGVFGSSVSGRTGITPNVQWEPIFSNVSGVSYEPSRQPPATLHPDLVLYDAYAERNSRMLIAELKLEVRAGGEGPAKAALQAAAYRDLLASMGKSAELLDLNAEMAVGGAPGYTDEFRVELQSCGRPTINYEVWYQYAVTATQPGVVMVDGDYESEPCGSRPPGPPPEDVDDEVEIPIDVEQPEWTDCMVNAAGVAVDAAEWLTEKSRDLSYSLLAPGSLRIATSTRPPTPAELAAARAATIGVGPGAFFMASAVAGGMALGVATSCAIDPNVFGDPHLVTLDDRAYDLQTVGEFHLVEDPATGLDVQARFVPVGSSVSVTEAVAVAVAGQRVELRSNGQVLVDGDVDVAAEDGVTTLADGSLLVRSGSERLLALKRPSALVRFQSGTISISMDEGVRTRGLLGNNDGNPHNDLVTASGEQLPADVPARVLYGRYADSWRVGSDESNFSYLHGQGTETFTDRSFPQDVKTLADYSTAELNAASKICREGHVSEGPAFEDCVYDLVSTGDDRYVSVAASVGAVVDPAGSKFTNEGVLSESFDGTIGSAFAAKRYVQDPSLSTLAAPIFDAEPYSFAVVAVPRHDSALVGMDILTFGPTESDGEPQGALIQIDNMHPVRVVLEGTQPAIDSPGGTVQFIRNGTLSSGTDYRIYRVELPAAHASQSLTAKLKPFGFRGVTDTSLGVDNIRVELNALPAEDFATQIPFNIAPDVPSAGAGRLETPGSQDTYSFELTHAQAVRGLLIESACASASDFRLREMERGTVLQPSGGTCASTRYLDLKAGGYQLEVASFGRPGPYSAKVLLVPLAEAFDFQVGQKVEPGKIADVAVAGAGNLETTASKDVYRFTVPAD
ncbi:VWD domain-containing protein, partial [Nocardioides sp. 616]|uniref:VWD domain-containing protein n=1 Tax=Nocardioides sp. 616 TaxID=2268090 RepID=UPI0019652C93